MFVLRALLLSLQLVVGSAGLLVFVAALMLLCASSAASAAGVGSGPCDVPRAGPFFPCARLDLAQIDDLRPVSSGDDIRAGA